MTTKGAANLSKINKIPSRSLNHSFQQTKQWQPLLENKQFTGMHVVNRNKLQEDFLLPSKLMTKEMNFHKTDYLVPYSSESVKDLLHTARQIEESRVAGKGKGNPAHSSAQSDKLKTHYQQSEKYGKAGVRELSDGRIRYYGEITPPSKAGEMAGRRVVREWNPATGLKRTWHETLDHNGMIRQVRPDVKFTGGSKVHYQFDGSGNYIGKW